jgi:hypothetical protein
MAWLAASGEPDRRNDSPYATGEQTMVRRRSGIGDRQNTDPVVGSEHHDGVEASQIPSWPHGSAGRVETKRTGSPPTGNQKERYAVAYFSDRRSTDGLLYDP